MDDKFKKTEQGSILLTVVIMLVLLSLGAGMVLMFGSATFQKVGHNLQLRATHMSESGFRYAAGEYRSEEALADKFKRLEEMTGETVTLLNNGGGFELGVNPYWFVTTKDYAMGATSLKVKLPGKFPEGFKGALPDSGRVMIGMDLYDYTGGSPSQGTGTNPDTFTLKLNDGLTADLPAATNVLMAFTAGSALTISQNGNLRIQNADEFKDLFPDRNGVFEVRLDRKSFGAYRYASRATDTGDLLLKGLTAEFEGEFPLTVNASSDIIVKKQLLLDSTGIVGSGMMGSERQLSLNVPLTDEMEIPADAPEPLDLGGRDGADTFIDDGTTTLDNWEVSPAEELKSEQEKKTITTLNVETEFGDGWRSSNYVTFQNFSEVFPDRGYTAELIDKSRIPRTARTKNLRGVWGNAADNIYFVGDGGTILHYDGAEIKEMKSKTEENLNAIWGVPSVKTSADEKDKIFVVGNQGTSLINQGGGWNKAKYLKDHREYYDIYACWGTGWDHFDGYGEAGTNPYFWSSSSSNKVKLKNFGPTYRSYVFKSYEANLRCLWAVSYTYPYEGDYGGNGITNHQNIMVGDIDGRDGIILHEFYTPVIRIPGVKLRGVWGSSFLNVYVVGDRGKIFRNTDGEAPRTYKTVCDVWRGHRCRESHKEVDEIGWMDSWHEVAGVGTEENLNGIYGNSEDDFYVIGDNGTILYNKGDGFETVPTAGVTGEDLNSIWGSDRTGIYAVGDNGTIVFLGYPSEKIGGHILPLKKNGKISKQWKDAGNYLSYTVQVKHVWGTALKYAASGICFRWHRVGADKHAGYGASLVRYDSSSNQYNDLIPRGLKPQYGLAEKNDRLLVVLWEQYVQGGAEKRRWLAYKDITDDQRVARTDKGKKYFRDLVSLIVRVEEKRVEGVKVNDINLYYGNAANDNRTGDSQYNNIKRYKYNPTFADDSNHIKWPVFDLDSWTDCQGGTGPGSCQDADFCTLVDDVPVANNPNPSTGASYWKVNPDATCVVLKNNFTIRSTAFVSPDSSFGSQSERSEIALHVFGNIGDHGSQELVSFTDFGVLLGAETAGVNKKSHFGSLQ